MRSEKGWFTMDRDSITKSLLLLMIIIPIMFLVSCLDMSSTENLPAEARGNWPMAASGYVKFLGPTDQNVGYFGITAKVKMGERIVIKGQFPHCRYISFSVYDQNFMVADFLTDVKIKPSSGANPFVPGTDRSQKWLGEYEIQVVMDAPPKGERPPNTLYAGLALNGKPNRFMALGYRVYLPDKGLGLRDKYPLALSGGVPPPELTLFNKKGEPYFQSARTRKIALFHLFGSLYMANRKKYKDPGSFLGEPQSPPVWLNNSSLADKRSSTVVPNDDTAYIATPVSGKYGQLLVLRWKAPRTPMDSWLGKPISPDVDMRYWSVSFDYVDMKEKGIMVLSEKTFADVDAPILPDGTRQMIIGIGGMERPASVPPEQWFGIAHNEGMLIVRNIVITPSFSGNFWNLPAGPIPIEYDKYTPGGVYCSVEEFTKNPDIGLMRADLLKKKR